MRMCLSWGTCAAGSGALSDYYRANGAVGWFHRCPTPLLLKTYTLRFAYGSCSGLKLCHKTTRVSCFRESKKVLAKRVNSDRFSLLYEGAFQNRKNDMADSSGTLNACADYTRRGAAAAPDHDADHADRARRVIAEQKRLLRWAEENDRLRTRHRAWPEFARGGEHLVFYRQSNKRYYKATLAERQKGYGISAILGPASTAMKPNPNQPLR